LNKVVFFALIVDSDGKILDINKSFLSLFFENKIEDKNIWEYSCWPESEKKWLESIFRNYTDGEKVQKELNIYDLDGKPRVLEIVISSFEIDEHIEYVLIALDITIKNKEKKNLKMTQY